MSFCRITGKSRGLPKPNYFPLLPPISPADAKRLCRITNKSQGLPSHHYIPALSGVISAKTHCKVTGKSKGQGPHHFPNVDGISKPHTLIPGYRYVFPKFDEEQKNQKNLLNLISSKAGVGETDVRYVYCVEEKKTNLVIPAGLEAAVRDGEVRDVMLDNEGDTILIKMYRGPNLTVDVENFILGEGIVMWDGLGPSEAVLQLRETEKREDEERKAKRLEAIKVRKKVFEDKEKAFDKEQLEEASRQEIKKAKLSKRESLKENHVGGYTTFNEKLFSSLSNEKKEPVFGHIVHTSSSVTFFPGTSVVDLPEGKIIPGRMIHHKDGVKFVPGIIVDGDFIPGQMVVTNKGEEFVPGQVIETCEGAKFVPGQVVETSSGPKFVPGQTIETENGPQFVPGQIIETKAGPTFIPGQIIVTDNQAKFVPGRVIETAEGPRFVPGRVIETGDQVTFVSGQVVETPEGLKFIAPDLENYNDGAQEFSVQGFEVTPEELKLLRPATGSTTSESMAAIDSDVLQRLSSAGMSVGRQINTELPRVDVRSLPVTSERLKLTGEHATKMAQVVVNLVRLAYKVSKDDQSCTSKLGENVGIELMRAVEQNKDLEKYLRVIVASAVVACRHKQSFSEETLMTAVSLALESTLGEAVAVVSADTVVDTLHQFLRTPENLNQIILEAMNYLEKNETVKDRIEFALNENSEPTKVIKKLSKTLEGNMSEAFEELLAKDHSLLGVVLEQLKTANKISFENQAEETIQTAIISAVKEKSKQTLKEMMAGQECKSQAEIKDFQNLLHQSVALAKALGMYTVAGTLLEVVSDSKSHELLCSDPTVMNILQRLTVMRQIAEVNPEFSAALKNLINNPEAARSDPSMRELMRRSTALLVVPKKNLQSSADIPLSLVMSSNPLAVEEYLGETKRPRILLIIKSGLQAVVPREAARAVLTGQVPYAVVDEKGIKFFEPLHVFSTMRLPKYAARCFSMYCCSEVDIGKNSLNSIIPNNKISKAKEFKIIKRPNDNQNHSYSFRRFVKNTRPGDESETLLEKENIVEISNEEDSASDSKRLKLNLGEEPIDILDNSAAKHKLSIRPKKKHGDPRQRTVSAVSESSRCVIREDVSSEGQVSSDVFRHQSNNVYEDRPDVRCKREAVVKELLETEEEFGRDLAYVVDHYLKPLVSDRSGVPGIVRDNIEVIFSNFQHIATFHNTTLLEGIKYYSDEPRMLGKTFLRLERDFDKHTAYCRDEPTAQEFLMEYPQVTEFFEELSQKLGDGKSISEYLKLPVQRINDYQVLLKDLVKYSDKLGENTYDLQRALELMLAIPQRANDNKFLSNIEGFHGNIHKLGRLLKHDWFTVVSNDKTSKERYLFLFKGHIIICKVKKISEDRSVFILKESIPLSDIKIRDYPDDKTYEILRGKSGADAGDLSIIARKENSKSSWLSEISKNVPEVFKTEEKSAKDGDLKVGADTEKEQIVTLTSLPTKDCNQVSDEIISENENNILREINTEKTENMNRRYSTRRSYQAVEESYSMSSQREVYSSTQSSSTTATSRVSVSSVYDSRLEGSQNYESSMISSSSTRAISGVADSRRGSAKLSITNAEKPVFTRTINGLNLEPGETAVFECQLDSKAQVTWLKDNKALDDKLADRVSKSSSDDGTHRLELLHVRELDSGIYTAMAQNDEGYATCTAQLLVHKITEEEKQKRMEANAPMFTVRLKDTELLTNTNFRFMVKVKGNPIPDVRFYKDGVPIRRGDDHIKLIRDKADIGFYELVISDVQPTHAGVYSCKASNEYGEAQCEGTITVTDHKAVFEGLENEMILTPGEKPTFSWVKDGKPFDPDERFKVLLGNEDDSLALIFQHVKPEDAGLYTCVASTTTGRISCSAELSVQGSVVPLSKDPEKPKIASEQKSCEATLGGSAMLEAKILGFPRPDIKWYHEGEEIKASGRFKFLYEDQETMTLVIKNVNPRDGGCYKIIAKNELGEDCTELSLTVKGAPKIVRKMQDVDVKSEEVIKLSVLIEGSPAPDVKWYKDGKELKETERITFAKDGNDEYTLTIKKACATDAGSYSVVASNEINQCTDFCLIKVHSGPQILKKMEKNIDASEGEEITFQIKISDSTAKVKWFGKLFKGEVELQPDERKTKIIIDGDVHTLTILNADSNDCAEYTVEVSNEHGVTTDKGTATVVSKKCAPTFKKPLADTIAKEGQTDVEFSVEVNAYPKPKIRWYLGDTEITEKRTEYAKVEDDNNNCKLILKKVTTELKGKYTCKVENDCGSAETSAKLTVHSKPIFVTQLKPKITVEEGAELTLQIECAGCPDPEITWFKDGQEIHTDAHIKITRDLHRSESYSMTLTLTKGTDGGEYEAKASNCMGSATTKTMVEVFSKVTETAQEDVVKAVKQEPLETSQEAEGDQERPTGQETTKTKISFSETEWGGFRVEEVDNSYSEDKSTSYHAAQGIVEEALDTENVSEHRLDFGRGVSIVSLSEDDRTLSRNNSALDLEKLNEDEETAQTSGKKSGCAEEKLKGSNNEVDQSDFWTSPTTDKKPKDTDTEPDSDFWASLGSPSTKASQKAEKEIQQNTAEKIVVVSAHHTAQGGMEPSLKNQDLRVEIPKDIENDFWASNTDISPVFSKKMKAVENDYSISSQTASEGKLSPAEEISLRKIQSDEGDHTTSPENASKPITSLAEYTVQKPEDDFWASLTDSSDEKPTRGRSLAKIIADESDYRTSPAATTKPGHLEDNFPADESHPEGNFWDDKDEKNLDDEKEPRLPRRIFPNTAEENDFATSSAVGKTIEVKEIPWVDESDPEKEGNFLIEKIRKDDHKTSPQTAQEIRNNESDSSPDDSENTKNNHNEGKVEMFEAPLIEPKKEKLKAPLKQSAETPTPRENGEGPGKVSEPSANDEHESDGEDDPTVKALLSRIKKQRSVLEEILTKEAESRKEGSETEQKPSFKTPLKDQKCTKKDVAVFTCVVASSPEPEVTWLLNGKEVKTDGVKIKSECSVKEVDQGASEYTYTLKIAQPESADAGLYMIKAKNKYGYDESSASLTIQLQEDTKPQIKNLKDVTVVPEEDATFEAEVISALSVVVIWLNKTGEKIKANDRFILSEDKARGLYKLVIKNVKAEDEGEYTLVATNDSGERRQGTKLAVTGERPTIVKPPEDTRIKDSTDIDFQVRCNGIPKPDVEWFKDGKKLTNDGRISIKTQTEGLVSSSLTIEKFQVADEGQYKVVATNVLGSAENEFNLKLAQLPPVLEKGLPRSEDIDEEEVLELKCKLSGSPIPQLAWFKDGVPLTPSGRVKITQQPDGLVKLSVEGMKPNDSGTYTMKAENPNGQITANCAVAVHPKSSKPKIADGLKDAEAEVGKPLKLETKVLGFPAPEIKWFKDGKPLKTGQAAVHSYNPEDGTIELNIKALKPEDAGVYSVKVSNKFGDVTQEAKVNVIKPQERPKLEANMMPVSVVEGFPAKFDVKAMGNPKPVLKWFHNGKEIVPDGIHIAIKEQQDGTVCLLIDKATPVNAGEYVVKAVNNQGEATSKAALTVLGKKTEEQEIAPSFLRPLTNVAVNEGDDLHLSAPIAGNPIPEVTWEKDVQPLLSDDRVLLTCDGKTVNLEVKNCKPSDKGVYTCYLKNPLGNDKSKANVDVKKIFAEPVFVEIFKDMEQVQNTDAKFVARITGNPKPEAEWFYNGEPIKYGDKYQINCESDKYSLLVKNCTATDRGLYRCSAFNRAGRSDCVANLKVVPKIETSQMAEPPSFLKKISDCDIYKGMIAKFTACVAGFPEPEFEWFHGNEKLRRNNRITMESQENGLIRLTISGVNDSDVGAYRLRIFNSHGEAECSASLICDVLEARSKKAAAVKEDRREKLSGVPVALSDKPIISRMTDRHLTLSWKPYIPPGPGAPATYIVEMCKLPDGDWFTVRRGIRSCACDIRNLEPFQDYKFRVRVENKYGISDPSPFAVTYRQKIIPDPPKFVPYLSPEIDFRPETSPYFPKDFDLERPPHDRYEQAPQFLRQEHEVQYGVKNQNSNLFWFVYGYPKPTMTYYFNDTPIEMGGRYESSYTRNGQATLFINRMLERDVGIYEAVAKNEHGEARQRVRLEIAEHPVFIQRPEETYIMLRESGQLTARIVGVPYPEIKWYKDWQPLAPSSRVKIQQIEPDVVMLTINDAIMKDEGLYSVSATNVAGSVSSSVVIHIEEQEEAYKYATYGGGLNIKTRSEPHSNYYDIGDELGRGTQGITYHAVERRTGYNFAAKFMHGRSDLKPFMLNELNIMNSLNHRKLIRLHDSFEAKDLLVLVMELAAGGELLEWLIKQTYVTEYEIADYIRQILWGLEYMHSNGYAHLSLTLNDLLMSRADGDDLKICDFGLSRRITHGSLLALNYGMPEFVAPEVVKGEGVSYSADLWSLGIITYILLSGFSPFKGSNDRETLTRIKEGTWKFEDCFSNISSEAKDFVTKLLAYRPEDRMDVKTALRHPWIEKIGLAPPDTYKIRTDNLKEYHSSLKNWYKNANCRTWYRRQPLETAFTHPSKMVYPPAHDYTPEPEVIPAQTRQVNGRPAGNYAGPLREPQDYEPSNFKSESHYQCGPDTYLLQLRDVDLPCRLRHYMKVAADREQKYYSEPPEKHFDARTPVIRERRKYMDVMDEEIDDERRQRMIKYGSDDIYSLRRLKHEVSCRSDGRAEAEAMMQYKRDGQIPFFREKPQNLGFIQNQPAEFSCLVVGDPDPVVQWFRNDLVLAETSRIKMTKDENKRYYLRFEQALHSDVGTYKVVAKNKVGQTVARMRMALATVPLSPDSPVPVEASDTEVLLKWKQECDDPFTPVICYSLQYKQADSIEWITVCKSIDKALWLVKNLQPGTAYMFRLSSRNCAGWSAPGIPSDVTTKESGSPKVTFSETLREFQSQMESRNENEILVQGPKERLDYSVEDVPLEWIADSNVDAKYNFTAEIYRGQFSMVVKGVDKSNNQEIVAKFFEVNANTEKSVAQEFDFFKSLRHEKIVTLFSAMRPAPNIAIFIMEKLQGADILSYFASRQEYNEDMLVNVFTQVLDGLQYLHWRGYCHLDIQPDNIVLSSAKSLQVKLIDFGSVQRVSKLGTAVNGPITEYTAPEIINKETAFPQTDIWSLGTLLYVLLSGVSPFKAETEADTKQNITYVRYRFEHLYKEITQEATRLLMQIFKRTPGKRPTVDECYEARWFLSSESMVKKRMRATFPGSRLRKYNEAYHNEKSGKGLAQGELAKALGEKVLRRSNSVQEELTTF